MKRLLKRISYAFFIVAFVLFFSVEYLSTQLKNEFKQMQTLYLKNQHLSDATIICMQLYMLNPSALNEQTCLYLKFKISQNQQELEDLKFATFYLNYLEKN